MKRVARLLARSFVAALLVVGLHTSVASADPGPDPAATAGTLTQPQDPGLTVASQPEDPGLTLVSQPEDPGLTPALQPQDPGFPD